MSGKFPPYRIPDKVTHVCGRDVPHLDDDCVPGCEETRDNAHYEITEGPMTGDPHSEPLTSLQERAMEQVREYLRCVPCPNFCSRDGVLHANACCMSVADEPGFVDSLRSLLREVVGPVEKARDDYQRQVLTVLDCQGGPCGLLDGVTGDCRTCLIKRLRASEASAEELRREVRALNEAIASASPKPLLREIAAMRRALRTRPDYDFRCDDCGAPHNIDTSIPSAVWNAICENREGVTPGAAGIGMPEVGALCTLCIDERLVKAGLRCDEAEFYYGGTALRGKLYTESHGTVAMLERELAAAEASAQRLTEALGEALMTMRNYYGHAISRAKVEEILARGQAALDEAQKVKP